MAKSRKNHYKLNASTKWGISQGTNTVMVGWNLFPFPTVRIINARVNASQKNIPALQGCTSDTDERCTVKVTVYFPGQNSKTLTTCVHFQSRTGVKEGNIVMQNAPWQLSPAVGGNGHKIVTWLKDDHRKNVFYNEFSTNQLLNNSARCGTLAVWVVNRLFFLSQSYILTPERWTASYIVERVLIWSQWPPLSYYLIIIIISKLCSLVNCAMTIEVA